MFSQYPETPVVILNMCFCKIPCLSHSLDFEDLCLGRMSWPALDNNFFLMKVEQIGSESWVGKVKSSESGSMA